MSRRRKFIEATFTATALGLAEPPKATLDVRYPGGGLCSWTFAPGEAVSIPAGARLERYIAPCVFEDGFTPKIIVGKSP